MRRSGRARLIAAALGAVSRVYARLGGSNPPYAANRTAPSKYEICLRFSLRALLSPSACPARTCPFLSDLGPLLGGQFRGSGLATFPA